MTKITFLAFAAITAAVIVHATEPNKFEMITGGFIDKPIPEGSKILLLVNSTTSTNDVFKDFSKRLGTILHVPHKIVKADYEKLDNAKGDVVIAVVDGGDFTVYPNKHLAVVPIAEVNKDKILDKALAYALGESNDQANVRAITAGTKALGIPYLLRVSYKAALEQGWAPAPQTAAQKAVFEKFQTAKTNKVESAAPAAK